MALRAVRLPSRLRRQSFAAQDVLLVRDGFEMLGVDAGSVPAEMIDLQAGRDWSDHHLVRHAMRLSHLPVEVELAVPIHDGRCP
jgi:hypothetical protein